MKNSTMKFLRCFYASRTSCTFVLLFLFASTALVQTKAPSSPAAQKSSEPRGELNLHAARENPLQLRQFLLKMPKGGDLHNHLSGAVYAESWIRAAAEDHFCVDLGKLAFAKPEPSPGSGAEQPACGDGKVPAADAYKDHHLFDALVDAFSMRGFVPSPGVTGHDHFFEAFSKFSGTDHRHLGEWIDEIATRAAVQNEQYLELMHTTEFGHTAASVIKATQLTERVSMKFTFDVFNVTNTPSFDIPIDNVSQNLAFNDFPLYGTNLYSSPTLSGLGIVNKTIGSPRQIQMSLRLVF